MRTLLPRSILAGVLRRSGGANLTEDNATDAEVAKFFDFIGDRLRTAWEFHPWLETFVIEQRFFRPAWLIGSTYAAGAEVRFTDSAGVTAYWTPLASDLPAAGQSPESHPTKWTLLEQFRRVVEFEQLGETPFEACVAAYDRDPAVDPAARQLEQTLAGDGVVIRPDDAEGLTSVWLKLVARCEDFACVRWVFGEAYAPQTRVYYPVNGECYEVLTATTPGETPVGAAAAKFRRLQFPYILGRAVKSGVLADWLRSDGQAEQAAAEESQFYRLLDEQKWRLVGQQGQRGRIRFLPAR